MATEIEQVEQLKAEIIEAIDKADNQAELKTVQETHLSKKSKLNGMMSLIRNLAGDARIAFGQAMNNARNEINERFAAKQQKINDFLIKQKLEKETIDGKEFSEIIEAERHCAALVDGKE